MNEARTRPHWTAIAPVSLLAYVAIYALTVRPTPPFSMSGMGPWRMHPQYVVGGCISEVVFFPIHQLDRLVRSEAWKYYGYDEAIREQPTDRLGTGVVLAVAAILVSVYVFIWGRRRSCP